MEILQVTAKWLLVTVIVVIVTHPSIQQQCHTKSVPGHALIGYQYKQLSKPDYPGCLMECLTDTDCKSLNYGTTDGLCGLNSQTKESSPSKHFKPKNFNIYFTNVLASKSPAPPVPVKYPKSCRQIMNSGKSQGTGQYWLDPENTGSPFQAWCDMSTDGGGWTIVKKTIHQRPAPPYLDYLDINNYTDVLSSYHINGKNTRPTSAAIRSLKRVMGFDQIHFYCYKQTVGRVVSIMTKNNTAGHNVVEFFINDTVPLMPVSSYPDACGSFDRLPEDTSILGQNCGSWGPQPGKWGHQKKKSVHRITVRPFHFGTNFVFGIGLNGLSCDDPIQTSASKGDMISIAVR